MVGEPRVTRTWGGEEVYGGDRKGLPKDMSFNQRPQWNKL